MENKSYYLDQINDDLALMSLQLERAGRLNLQDRKVRAENIMRGLLNRIHGWNLENANMLAQNFPGVDLVDKGSRVAVQVTSTNSIAKVRNTWEKFDTDQMRGDYDRLIILVLKDVEPTEAMKAYQKGKWFDGAKDIWNIGTLQKQAEDLESVRRLKDISDYLKEQIEGIGRVRYRLPPIPQAVESFVRESRDAELLEMKRRLYTDREEGKTIYLYGVGGIGKTELAIQFAKNYPPSEGAYFMRCVETKDGASMRESILRMRIEGYRFEGGKDDDRQAEYEERPFVQRFATRFLRAKKRAR